MYQYKSRAKNINNRNRAIIDAFNQYPRVCDKTGIRYDIDSIYDSLSERFFLSKAQIGRILAGRATPTEAPRKKAVVECDKQLKLY